MDCSYVKEDKMKKDRIKRSLIFSNISTIEIAKINNVKEEEVLAILNENV
jgi:hypothetical protein